MKYTSNKSFGIGEILNIADGKATIYFEDIDKEKVMVLAFIKTFETIEEAEASLEEKVSIEDCEKIAISLEEEKRIMAEGAAASARLEEINIEASKELKKHI